MKYDIIECRVEGSQEYARLCTYIIDHSDEIAIDERGFILICPGGGYTMTSDREAEMTAFQFLAKGYHVGILRYSTRPSVFPVALLELGKAMSIVRGHAKEWRVNPDKIVVQGCSAGGHLTASLGVFWNEKFVSDQLGIDNETIKPNGLILNYPVITSGELAHRGSFEALLNGIETKELLEKVSLEKQVNETVPRTFIWHTYEDELVPVENSLLFVQALNKFKIPMEFHMYEHGEHGLGLANNLTVGVRGEGLCKQCENWVELACTWLENW
jgi:Esterase/lipase